MHQLTLTDVQLNEYLDNETTNERSQIESHLSSCDECAARLSTLQEFICRNRIPARSGIDEVPRRTVHADLKPASPTPSLAPADSDSASRHRVGCTRRCCTICDSTYCPIWKCHP